MSREFETGIANSVPDPISTFTDTGIREPNHREDLDPERHIDLDLHERRIDANDRRRSPPRKHGRRHRKDCSTVRGEGLCRHTDVLARQSSKSAVYRGAFCGDTAYSEGKEGPFRHEENEYD